VVPNLSVNGKMASGCVLEFRQMNNYLSHRSSGEENRYLYHPLIVLPNAEMNQCHGVIA